LPQHQEKDIEDIQAGDTLLVRENERSPKLVEAKVVQTFKHLVNEYLAINGSLRVTPEHNLFVNGRWMVAGDVRLGDHLLNTTNEWVRVDSIEKQQGRFEVYNLAVAGPKTFFANNFYVHNQKGRELFMDRAFFGAVRTDQSGRGQVSFQLPDNLTSWRITHQAISNTLGAGDGTKLLPVKLPFFVDMVMNQEYLESDRPVIKLRVFGENLGENDEVEFEIEAPSLGLQDPVTLKGRAYEAVPYEFPVLTEGEHKITVTARSGTLADKITRPITVSKTRLTKGEAAYYQLTPETKILGSLDSPTTLVFSNHDQGRFFSILSRLSYAFGDRVDQRLARIKAQELLSEYFDETRESEEFQSANYQTPGGGISLFPYSDADLALSAKATGLSRDLFDQEALKSFFSKVVNDRSEGIERTAIALSGLASLDEAVLIPVHNLLSRPDLTPIEQLYLGLAAAQLGDQETGREVLKDILENYGEELKPYIRVNVGQDQDDVLQATGLAADLAILVDDDQQDKLFQYVVDNYTEEILIYLEQLLYTTYGLPRAPIQEAQFTYLLNGESKTQTLKKGQVFKLQVTPEELATIQFSNISGQVGLTSFFTVPLASEGIEKDSHLTVKRDYRVGDVSTVEFAESDLVKVVIDYGFGSKALSGCHQITDWLPSGLKIISRPYSRGIEGESVWYPYEITNQRASFCVYQSENYRPVAYYARVISTGEYHAESAIIQSLKSVDSFNFSSPQTVTIK
jgi:hypothetical protein